MPVQPSLLPLGSLRPYTLIPGGTELEGTLVAVVPFNPTTGRASLDITQNNVRVQLRLCGSWAQSAVLSFFEHTGRRCRVSSVGGELLNVLVAGTSRDRNGDALPGGQKLCVEFKNGLQGWWKDRVTGVKSDEFRFMNEVDKAAREQRRRAKLDSSSDGLDVLPPSRQTAARQAFDSKTNLPPRSQTATPAPTPKLRVPATNPENPYGGYAAGESRGSKKRVASPEDGSSSRGSEGSSSPTKASSSRAASQVSRATQMQPEQKRARARRETRTTWGLKTDQRQYKSLDQFKAHGNQGNLNLIAMAIVARPIQKIEGKPDWGTVLRIVDPTNASSSDDLEIRYYGQDGRFLPAVNDGDIVVFHKLNWNKNNRQFVAYKGNGQYLILPVDKLLGGEPLSSFARPSERGTSIGDEELAYARDLARWSTKHDLLGNTLVDLASASGTAAPQSLDAKQRSLKYAKGSSGGRKLVTLSEMDAGTFCDFRGEIVKLYNPWIGRIGPNDAVQLFVTDYTSNSQLYNYDDTSEVRTPGQITLQVSIFGNQSEPLLGLRAEQLVGRVVFLRNVRPKMTNNDFLEATMVEDNKYPNRRDVNLVSEKNPAPTDWVAQFAARREKYWRELKGTGFAPIFDFKTDKPVIDPLTLISDTTGLEQQSVSNALALKQPGTFRFRVRISGFEPRRLEDWIEASCPVCDDVLSTGETACLTHNSVAYNWSFVLVLTDEADGSASVCVPVFEPASTPLFPNFDPALFPFVREGNSDALASLQSRFHDALGRIPSVLRRRQQIQAGDCGPAWDVVLDATKEEGPDGVEWQFCEGRVAFR
ncbi:uncharacterized protein JCM10292_000891 [Rhodotorula paludigena]|uniref:uncharacterized protein n=1 Tax=Rhodotorula paludigena TaxID=86838 RepID=UPI003177B1D8